MKVKKSDLSCTFRQLPLQVTIHSKIRANRKFEQVVHSLELATPASTSALCLAVLDSWLCRPFLSLKTALIRSCFSDKNIRTAAVIDDGVGLTTSWNLCVAEGGKLLVNPFDK
jgi:hypothetical protein